MRASRLLAFFLMTAAAMPGLAAQTLTKVLPFQDGPLLASPSFVTSWPGNPNILVVAERGSGKVTAWDPADGANTTTTTVDLSGEAFIPASNNDFIGVTGVAFHPHFNTVPNRRFIYVRFNEALTTGPQGQVIRTKIKRYPILPGSQIAQMSQAVEIYSWDTTSTVHGSGTIHFDTRSMNNPRLWVPMPDDTFPGNCDPANQVQDVGGPSDLGKLLAINVNANPPTVAIRATGLRNPYGFSVDRGASGTLQGQGDVWIGDVGQAITGSVLRFVPTGGFRNYGWPWYEGDNSRPWMFGPAIQIAPCGPFDNPPTSSTYLPPSSVEVPTVVFSDANEYGGNRDALLGGYVYRGMAISALSDRYVFATLGNLTAFGPRIYSLPSSSPGATMPVNHTAALGMSAWGPDDRVYGLGQDSHGELYVIRVNNTASTTANGSIYKVTP